MDSHIQGRGWSLLRLAGLLESPGVHDVAAMLDLPDMLAALYVVRPAERSEVELSIRPVLASCRRGRARLEVHDGACCLLKDPSAIWSRPGRIEAIVNPDVELAAVLLLAP
jgi:hypothetical protein